MSNEIMATTFGPMNSTLGALERVLSSPYQDAMHIVALTSQVVSIIFSICTLYVFWINALGVSFYHRKQSARLVFYLAVCDLMFSTEHMSSHILNIVHNGRPPVVICTLSGFFMQVFFWTQAIVVVICAASAFLLVVKGIKTKFGRYDHRLIIVTVSIPVCVASVFAGRDYFGTSGRWCHVDIMKHGAKIVYVVNSIMWISVSIACALLYAGLWIKISRVNKLLEASSGEDEMHRNTMERHRTAKILVCFVVAYFAQWWPMVLHGIWFFLATPPEFFIIFIVLFCNLGGLLNFFAYTFIRQIQQKNLPSQSFFGSAMNIFR